MSVIEELIRNGSEKGISFGNYKLNQKTKRSDFEFEGNMYKIKTYDEITRLEKNDTVLYESVPGTAVHDLTVSACGISFSVEGEGNVQITLGLEDDTEYDLMINGRDAEKYKTSMGGKLSFSVDLKEGDRTQIEVKVCE